MSIILVQNLKILEPTKLFLLLMRKAEMSLFGQKRRILKNKSSHVVDLSLVSFLILVLLFVLLLLMNVERVLFVGILKLFLFVLFGAI